MDASLKHRLFRAAFRGIAATQADRWLAPVARGRGLILTFHQVRPWTKRDFAPNRLLEITPEFLDRTLTLIRESGFEIVPMDEVAQRLAGRTGKPFVALTFDDGYRDNREHALPVLKRHGAPWTMYAVTEYAEGRGRLWWLELEAAIARLGQVVIGQGRERLAFRTRDAAEKREAFEAIYWRLRAGPEMALRSTIADLAYQAGFDTDALVRGLCLSFDEIAELACAEPDLTIGAHTLTHPMLAKHEAEVAQAEIQKSKAILEARLERPVRHLSYPVGDRGSAGPREFAMAREAGFATGVTTRPGHLFAAHAAHLTALPRVSVNGHHQSDAAIRALLSGVPFLAWNRLRRLDVR